MVGTKEWKALREHIEKFWRAMEKLDCSMKCTIQYLDNGGFHVTIDVSKRQSSPEMDNKSHKLADEAGYESEPKPVIMGMIEKVEADDPENH